jgi:hypothetical protein
MTEQLELLAKPTHPKASQRQLWDLLTAFRRGEVLTFFDAADKYRCRAISQRTGDLRKLGWPIKDKWVDTPGGARIKAYYL